MKDPEAKTKNAIIRVSGFSVYFAGGRSCLHLACAANHSTIVRLLLASGLLGRLVPDAVGLSPVAVAVLSCKSEAEEEQVRFPYCVWLGSAHDLSCHFLFLVIPATLYMCSFFKHFCGHVSMMHVFAVRVNANVFLCTCMCKFMHVRVNDACVGTPFYKFMYTRVCDVCVYVCICVYM